jgi:hypothetical protein
LLVAAAEVLTVLLAVVGLVVLQLLKYRSQATPL